MSTVNRILVDSRLRQPDSVSTSDFRIELNETVAVEENMKCVVTDVCIPVCWCSIEASTNDKLYLRLYDASSLTSWKDYVLRMPARSYTRTEFAQVMTQLFTDAIIPLQANDDPYRNLIRIFNSAGNERSFSVFTNNDLKTRCNNTWTGEYYMITNTQSVNDMMANSEGSMTI
jgi:hypothetical protein